MAWRTLATLILGLVLLAPAQAQRSSRYSVVDESSVARTLSFATGGGRTLDVRNLNGFIHVDATGGSTVEMSVRKVIRAETGNDLAAAQRDVRLDFRDSAARVEAIVTGRLGHVCGEPSNERGDRRERVHYDVRFDFTIRVPRGVALRLCTINGGDILVNGTEGDFEVDNVNGPIEMNRVAGGGSAHTVNGPVTVTFTANPKRESSFKSVNGNIDVSLIDGLDAEFAMKTFNGGLFTDFEVQALPVAAWATSERQNGRFVYRRNEFTRVRVGSGGPQITFETLNGNVRTRRGRAQ